MKQSKGIMCAIALVVILIILASIPSIKNSRMASSYSHSSSGGYSHSSTYSSNTSSKPPVNRELPMTKEEAERLKGTGYHGCRPNSPAENTELKAAQAKCSNCGYHTTHGDNSLCDYCAWMYLHGGGLPAKETASSSGAKNNTSATSNKNSRTNDPLAADAYAHPDDFYYDHIDDFVDYEEAEEYWESAH